MTGAYSWILSRPNFSINRISTILRKFDFDTYKNKVMAQITQNLYSTRLSKKNLNGCFNDLLVSNWSGSFVSALFWHPTNIKLEINDKIDKATPIKHMMFTVEWFIFIAKK